MKTIVLEREACYCDIQTLYENIAEKLGVVVTDRTRFNCSKIRVTKQIKDAVWAYYKETDDREDSFITTAWVSYGPKASLMNDGSCLFRVEVDAGFIVTDNTTDAV